MDPVENLAPVVTRRDAFKTLIAGAALLGLNSFAPSLGAATTSGAASELMLPKLPYAFDALEPHIDAQTMEIHHTKHHQAYINAANKALAAHSDLRAQPPEELIAHLDKAPEAVRTTLRNQLGGHLNHSFFWTILSPKGGGKPQGKLEKAIESSFGSLDAFKQAFAGAAGSRFGSGWAWLTYSKDKLEVISTANQDSPLMDGKVPVLGLDVWEHAYYLKYQNRRADYVKAFWNVVDWSQVGQNFEKATSAAA